jgi:hypothetical protein
MSLETPGGAPILRLSEVSAVFEEELKLEKRFNIMPLLMVLILGGVVVGTIVYFVNQSRQTLTQEQAASVLSAMLADRGPATLHFHTGLIKPAYDEKPGDPHYRLLEKAGYVKVGKTRGDRVPISFTADGQQRLDQLGCEHKTAKDGEIEHVAPLAERRLVTITKLTNISSRQAVVEFTWTWEPNELGKVFDANHPTFKSFPLWERMVLLDKYGVRFYTEPIKDSVRLVRTEKGWMIS